jgi:phage baseplate assembly protein W
MDNSIYSDLDLTFKPHPITGDLMVVKDSVAVIRSIKNLLMTNHYEKPFKAMYGSNIRKLLFEPLSPFVSATLMKEITNTIKNYEPRATIKELTVIPDYDNNAYSVNIQCYIDNLVTPFMVAFLLYRLR